MKRMISGLLSLMMLSMTGAACLPAQAAERDYAETTTTAETTATTVADVPSEVLQMSLNFNTIDWTLGTPLYLDGITACVFSQKNGYILAGESITNEKYFKLDTFEVDHADRPGTYNIYVAYNDQSVDLYTILYVNMYAETEPAETTGFNPAGTVMTTTTSYPVWTGGTVQTTIDPTPDTEMPVDTTAETTFDAVGTVNTTATTKQTYRTTLPTRETQTTTAVTTYYRTTLPTTETTQRFDPVGTVVTTGTTAKPQETTAAFTTNLYTNEDGVVCYEYYANIGDTIPVDEAYIGLPCIVYEEHARYENGIITAMSAGEFYIVFCTSETFAEQVARVDVTIVPDPNGTTASSETEPEWTKTTMMSTWNTTLPTTGMTTARPASNTTAVPESTLDEDGNVIYHTTATSLSITTSEEAPIATTTTRVHNGEGTTVATTVTTAPATTPTGTEIAPETTKPDTESGASRAGDTNGDGEVNILDVIKLNRNLLCGEVLDAQAIRNADVDGDGMPSFADALMILKYTIRLITSF